MKSEARIQNEIRLETAKAGARLFRNNCGQFRKPSGEVIRYGVSNPGGSDLIGWTTITITPDMVGKEVAVFTAVEVKTARGRPSEKQVMFIDAVNSAGGMAGIARSAESALKIISG